MPKRLDSIDKQGRRLGRIATFVQQYGRKAQKGKEPNDRRFDKSIAQQIKQMDPEQLDRLLRADD